MKSHILSQVTRGYPWYFKINSSSLSQEYLQLSQYIYKFYDCQAEMSISMFLATWCKQALNTLYSASTCVLNLF